MTTYRAFPATSGPSSPSAATGGWMVGMLFSPLSKMLWLDGYWRWVPPGGDVTAHKFALWNQYSLTQQSLVPNSVVTSGTLTAGQWNFVPLPASIQLAPGALYVACAGWTAVNGVPLTAGQFTSGGTFSAGIVNGPLTVWSAQGGTNAFPASTGDYNLGQGMFSNSLGSDPSVAMPNNGSGSDNFWVDVQMNDTAPSSYAGTFRLWPNMGDLGNYSLDTANNFTLATEFSLSKACKVNNIWFYSPSGVTQLPTEIGVYQVSGTSLVASNVSPSWSGAAGSGWMHAAMGGNVVLSPGVNYKVVVFNGAGSPAIWNAAVANYWSGSGFGTGGLVSGPITAPNAAGATPGQESYNLGGTIAYPNTIAGPFHYGTDIELTPLSGSGLLIGLFP